MLMLRITVFHAILIVLTRKQRNLVPLGTASQSSDHLNGTADKALAGPASNDVLSGCTHTALYRSVAWWKIEFPTDCFFSKIKVYYRYLSWDLSRSDGYSLYITNSSSIGDPPNGQLCFKDEIGPPYPDLINDIYCSGIGKNIVLYNKKPYVSVEICYIEIYGCEKTKWGVNCSKSCSSNCIQKHCFPSNGSCVWGCDSDLCVNNNCDSDEVCVDGCISGRAGKYCDKYNNLVLQGAITQNPAVPNMKTNFVKDGDRKSCTFMNGTNSWIQVDLGHLSVITTVYLHFGESSYITRANHSIIGSNSSQFLTDGINLYIGGLPSTDISIHSRLFRYLTYIPTQENSITSVSLCEIEVIGCTVGRFGKLCNQQCPAGCNGPCHSDTGVCLFGCIRGRIGLACDQECTRGTFGQSCSENCIGCIDDLCNSINGTCSNQTHCKPGWKHGPECNIPCDNWYYGVGCAQICNCLDEPCDKSTGRCEKECKEGWKGPTCNQECSKGEYGFNCNGYCSTCVNHACDRYIGKCTNGCIENFYGDLCNLGNPPSAVEANVSGVIGIGIGATAMILSIATIIFICIRHRNMNGSNRGRRNFEPGFKVENINYTDLLTKNTVETGEISYTNICVKEDEHEAMATKSKSGTKGEEDRSEVVDRKSQNVYEDI